MKQDVLLCVDNEGYEPSSEARELYEMIPDKEAKRHNQVKITDEPGEDYLCPLRFFAPVRPSMQTRTIILKKST
jgi:hypothetical protein